MPVSSGFLRSLLLSSLLFTGILLAQSGLSLRFLPQQADAQWVQPAWAVLDSGLQAQIGGGLGFRANLTPLTVEQVLGLPSFLDEATKTDLLTSLQSEDNRIQAHQLITGTAQYLVGPLTLGVGYRNRIQAFGQLNNPQTLGLALFGNARYAGDSISDQGLEGYLARYQEFSMAAGYKRGIWQAGVRLKLLTGSSFVGLQNGEYQLYTEPNGRFIDLQGSYSFLQTDSLSSAGTGVAVDLGVVVQPMPGLTVQAALIDLGSLNWQGNMRARSFDIRYEGIEVSNLLGVDTEGGFSLEGPDSLIQQVWGDSTAGNMRMGLPTQLHVGAQYDLSTQDVVFASLHYGFDASELNQALFHVGYKRLLGQVAEVGINGYVGGHEGYGVGAFGAVRIDWGGPFIGRIYITADNLVGALAQGSASAFVAQGGLSLSWRP